MSNRLGTAALASAVGSLLAVVVGIGVVSLFAEWRGVWTSYFLMERTIDAGAPVVAALGVLALLAGFVVVYGAT
ncbi:hypothetical protein HWV23_09425 [Natronomonas halophila]|uniref:hypothetical protein n=1 Tax=Natronomonas halophila TaxID=2747817 RepID=UPI0015B3B516|nr:hypothetical protein [Natronomonas halophila]QLD85935.1 hypothetical protein HWV23_09425 [Natronomonas halophila]